ncbi:hypothetical protein [Psychrobacter sp. DM4]|uniref:hypothetical protein n=1 Tax=Psychrobacter sp. DM4 TaxID=3440637 RepID=UPI003F500266
MNIIEHLEQTVSTVVLGNSMDAAQLSLLEQFYAILATRLSMPKVYSMLLRSDQINVPVHEAIHDSLFEQVWQDPHARQIIIKELSAAHHINEIVTTQLLINAAPIAYQALNDHASGQFLPAYLQTQQPVLRQYLPVWSAPVIADHLIGATPEIIVLPSSSEVLNPDTSSVVGQSTVADQSDFDNTKKDKSVLPLATGVEQEAFVDTDAIHANPSKHHYSEYCDSEQNKSDSVRIANNPELLTTRPFRKVRAHNISVRKISWLIFALAVLAGIGLTWALVIKPKQVVVDTPAPPTMVTPTEEPAAIPLTPISMIVGVDDSGQLYTCNATVGNITMQNALIQAFNVSFGEQASTCEVTIAEGVATGLSNMTVQRLPDMLTLLRAVPFARLQLQDERIILEAPDDMLLQQLLGDMRIIVPTMQINSAVPIPLPDSTAINNENTIIGVDNATGMNNSLENEALTNQSNNETSSINNYQPNDDTGDRIISDPLGNNIGNDIGSSAQNRSQNTNRGISPLPTVPAGPISVSEVDEMASREIRVDPVRAN